MIKYERLYTADEVDGMIARAKAKAAAPVPDWNRASEMISLSKEDAKSVMKALDDFDGWADHGCPPSTAVAVKIMREATATATATELFKI
jgi:hypothetical protein